MELPKPQHSKSPKPPRVEESSGDTTESAELMVPSSGPLNLADALGVLRYLEARKVLCTLCGYRLATEENQIHAVCVGCRPNINQTFSPRLRKVSKLDEVLCKRLTEWAETYITNG